MPFNFLLTDQKTLRLVSRLNLRATLYRSLIEEEIVDLVGLDDSWVEANQEFLLNGLTLDNYLDLNFLSVEDFRFLVRKEESLRRFAEYHFSSGLEEYFLKSKELRDQVVYSLIRVHDPALIREIWIRLEENEMTFAQASSAFGEGPEVRHNGQYGPMSVGALQPAELASIVRNLKPGQLMKPRQLGEWHLIIRLEQLLPARFDGEMSSMLLFEQLNQLIDERVARLIADETPEPLNFEPA